MSEPIEPMQKKNPFAIPEPYYLPGYTGHCPAYSETVGQTYGRATHNVMESSTPGRLKPISSESQNMPGDPDLDIIENRKSEGRSVLTKNITPGYKGHIPRARGLIGLNFNQSCIKGVAEFEKKKKDYEEYLKSDSQKGG
ncbi:protein FAM166B-like [Argiope bruennichi]|uniref:protein FAM166B-like n=1 Tax=Argiope bruennichi TaxID=94029 RepID=UPI0024949186|nr:protein FAM166B-like [Argiope bruennichi]